MTDMPEIRDSHEPERGCGFRAKGGTYLMGGALAAPCGKLPHALDKCPTCNAGIKPTRGWTWLDASKLFEEGPCQYGTAEVFDSVTEGRPASVKTLTCGGCPLGKPPEKAGLLWIGERFYPTVADFAQEAARMGVSRRLPAGQKGVPRLPKGLEVGKTLVLLAHRKGMVVVCPDCGGKGRIGPDDANGAVQVECKTCNAGTEKVYAPAIFAAFVPKAIEYVVKGTETAEELERIKKRGVELVNVIPEKKEPEQADWFPECPERPKFVDPMTN